jgi:hypothetical protein
MGGNVCAIADVLAPHKNNERRSDLVDDMAAR